MQRKNFLLANILIFVLSISIPVTFPALFGPSYLISSSLLIKCLIVSTVLIYRYNNICNILFSFLILDVSSLDINICYKFITIYAMCTAYYGVNLKRINFFSLLIFSCLIREQELISGNSFLYKMDTLIFLLSIYLCFIGKKIEGFTYSPLTLALMLLPLMNQAKWLWSNELDFYIVLFSLLISHIYIKRISNEKSTSLMAIAYFVGIIYEINFTFKIFLICFPFFYIGTQKYKTLIKNFNLQLFFEIIFLGCILLITAQSSNPASLIFLLYILFYFANSILENFKSVKLHYK